MYIGTTFIAINAAKAITISSNNLPITVMPRGSLFRNSLVPIILLPSD
jgi:hypothetical protein